MSGKDHEPWFRGYGFRFTSNYFWVPIHWKGVLLTLALVAVIGFNILAIGPDTFPRGEMSWLIPADAVLALAWWWVFRDRVEWVERARRKRKKNDLRNGLP